MRLALAAGLAGLALLAGTHTTDTHDPRSGTYRACYEDEAIVWSGRENSHVHCIPVDDIPRMLWQECVALAEGTDQSLQECDDQYGKHSM